MVDATQNVKIIHPHPLVQRAITLVDLLVAIIPHHQVALLVEMDVAHHAVTILLHQDARIALIVATMVVVMDAAPHVATILHHLDALTVRLTAVQDAAAATIPVITAVVANVKFRVAEIARANVEETVMSNALV